jgi:hypothetical protein
MIEKLNAVLSSPAKVRAFPELKAGSSGRSRMLNKTALARLTLAEGLDGRRDDDALGGEIGQVRSPSAAQLEAPRFEAADDRRRFRTRERRR